MPPAPARTLVVIRPSDVALGVIAHHVHISQHACVVALLPSQDSLMLPESILCKCKRPLRRLPKQLLPQPHAFFRTPSDGVEDALEGRLEATLTQAREVVGGGPEEIWV